MNPDTSENLDTSERTGSPRPVVLAAAAALAAAMGVGRFAFTPILPLMQAQAGMSAGLGASLATANYVGYLAGALVGIAAPGLVHSTAVLRGSLLALVASLALMPVLTGAAAWSVLRLVAGAASALIFMVAVSAALSRLDGHAQHWTGWVFGGVGGGIAASGLLVLALRTAGGWREAWWACAVLAAVLTALAWRLVPEARPGAAATAPAPARAHRWFGPLLAGYALEGVGYIIAGTFLVAAIEHTAPGPLGSGAWVLVGLAALPSCAVWARLSLRWSRPALLLAALLVQAVGIALPALLGGAVPALVSAVLFGATFMGISNLSLAIGRDLLVPRAVAMLTAGYSAGQILGPLLAAPLLDGGYDRVLLLAGAIVLAAAVAAAAVRIRYPHPAVATR
ncbi:YbfB/YjiJ family MFS transporter [Saccharopolyspora sp. NPDC047091]|uniref:YbfB/YjiJ family MFS transporter n=1 Tax=Saccharopolyspora sp. NPDC047091 TaxID=3155924 RepID=UPI0033F44A8C